jgi:hypothetical protein
MTPKPTALLLALLPTAAVAADPPAPDYTSPDAWAAFPGRPSAALDLPQGVPAAITPHRVDVFFIHPTTFYGILRANAAYNEGGITNAGLEHGVLRYQASAFNLCCDIYVPRYRQAALRNFFHDTPEAHAAFNLAYTDVENAFETYMAHYNHGRPFILASHSQGSLHAMRLLQEKIIGSKWQRQLVAAYTPGGNILVPTGKNDLPACNTPVQAACIVQWNSVGPTAQDKFRRADAPIWLDNTYQKIDNRPTLCVNPLNWRIDATAPAQANLGALPAQPGLAPLAATIPALTGATCDAGLLRINIPPGKDEGFSDLLTRAGSYHVFDYNLFYLNIRQNAAQRAAAYFVSSPKQ